MSETPREPRDTEAKPKRQVRGAVEYEQVEPMPGPPDRRSVRGVLPGVGGHGDQEAYRRPFGGLALRLTICASGTNATAQTAQMTVLAERFPPYLCEDAR